MSISIFTNEFCGMQKQNGNLIFLESGVYHACHFASSIAQRKNVVNFNDLICSVLGQGMIYM